MVLQSVRLELGEWSTRAITRRGGEHVVVFLHSLGADAMVWDSVTAALRCKATTVALDLRGQGASQSRRMPFTIGSLAADVVCCLDALRIDRCVLVGMSFGGMVAQAVSTAFRDRVTKLVLMDSACTLDDAQRRAWRERAGQAERLGMAGIVEETLARWFPRSVAQPDVVARSRLAKGMAAIKPWHYAAAALALADVDLVENAKNVEHATLVVVGEEDVALPPHCSALLAELIPQARLETLPGTGHCPPVEVPERVVGLLKEFVSEG